MGTNPLLDRLMNVDKEDAMHSSVYAKARNAERMGVSSADSFERRRIVDQNRTVVRGYHDSKIVNATRGMGFKAGKYDAKKDASQRGAIKEKFGNKEVSSANGGGSGEGKSMKKNMQPPVRRNPGIFR